MSGTQLFLLPRWLSQRYYSIDGNDI